ncbi:MAG TPA: di-heme oxidoredictase family protein [Pyrinomonadaceae bacterium]
MDLQETDPWLAYQMGSNYFQREWTGRDGLFTALAARPAAGAANSCAMCHNLPFRSPGAGGNVPEPGSFGRNTPHLFGIGLIETIGLQVRQQLFAAFDKNNNGFLDNPTETKGRRAIVMAAPNVPVDFGSLEDIDGDGQPDLNDVIEVFLVDRQGRPRPLRPDGTRSHLDDPGIAGYDFSVSVLSVSIGDNQFPTVRLFASGALRTVMGLRVIDPTVANNTGLGRDKRAADVWAEVSNAGAPQLHSPLPATSEGEPLKYVSEGELDLLEWFLLNHPAPAVGRQDHVTARGKRMLNDFGCVKCHVADWVIQDANGTQGLPGDRRFFNLEVTYNLALKTLSGRLQSLAERRIETDGSGTLIPRRRGFTVRGVFTDLLHHDMGGRFADYTYAGGQLYVNRRFRTPPLWGVGSTAPYGHDGRSPTLDDVIRRHDGEAKEAAWAYIEAPAKDRQALISFLQSLVLYQTDMLPTDLNDDGKIDGNFRIGGLEVGPERFWPELLFRTTPRYRGWVTSAGDKYFSYELLNLSEAYGRSLETLKDVNGNGIPDVVETKP